MFDVGDSVRVISSSNVYDVLYCDNLKLLDEYKQGTSVYIGYTTKVRAVLRDYFGLGIKCYKLERTGDYLWDDSSIVLSNY